MGILDTIAIVFVILKVAGAVDWSWWTVVSPWLVGYAIMGVIVQWKNS